MENNTYNLDFLEIHEAAAALYAHNLELKRVLQYYSYALSDRGAERIEKSIEGYEKIIDVFKKASENGGTIVVERPTIKEV